MPIKKITPQERWAQKQKNTGMCTRCSSPRRRYKWLCDFHGTLMARYMKKWRLAQKKAKQAKVKALKG